jgi:ATP citrate (pro-S)-lyase
MRKHDKVQNHILYLMHIIHYRYFYYCLQIRTIAIIAEGIPENMTRKLILLAQEKGVNIIGPATVGGIKPGCFKIGNTGGMMDNILHSKLYRRGR